jgi:hypothetical protein
MFKNVSNNFFFFLWKYYFFFFLVKCATFIKQEKEYNENL